MTEVDASQRILQACRKEIALTGVRGLRVQEVARRAGVSLGLVYYHFQDRAGLLQATLTSVNEAAQGRGTTPGSTDQDSLERVLLAELSGDDDNRDDSVVWNEIRAISVFETDLQPAVAQTTREWHASLRPRIEEAGVAKASQEECAMLLTTLVEGLSARWLSGQIDLTTAQSLMRSGISAIISAHSAAPER